MNPTLRELLLTTGLPERYVRSLSWSDVLIVHNMGGVPPAAHADADHVRHRGFNFILLDERGSPAYMGKCRPASDDEVAHESAVLEVLSRDPEVRDLVPETRGFSSGTVRIQIMRYVAGESFEVVVPTLRLADWAAAMEQILPLVRRIASRAEAVLPTLFPSAAPIRLFEATRPALDTLLEAGADREVVSTLATCLRAVGPVPPVLQHGDLCPVNILRDQRSWCILDFAAFGRDSIPMLDAYHLVRTCSALRAEWAERDRGTRTWLERMASDSAVAATGRETLRRALTRQGLTPSQGVAALASYAAVLAARLMSRRSTFHKAFLREACVLATGLRRGVPFATHLFGMSEK